jgi:hypothetical protein
MFLTLEGRVPCVLCGYRIRCLRMNTFRINKRSMRSQGTGLCWMERSCPECGTANHSEPSTYVISATDRPKVAAYRAKRWPEKRAA